MIVTTLPLGVEPVIDDARMEVLLAHPAVQGYLHTVEREAPGMDLPLAHCLAMGFLAIRETRAGRLHEYRALAMRTFDLDEHDVLIAAALAFLLPMVEAGERAIAADTASNVA
ncbi:hypothetical protein [Amnibacterium kyonggiense]